MLFLSNIDVTATFIRTHDYYSLLNEQLPRKRFASVSLANMPALSALGE